MLGRVKFLVSGFLNLTWTLAVIDQALSEFAVQEHGFVGQLDPFHPRLGVFKHDGTGLRDHGHHAVDMPLQDQVYSMVPISLDTSRKSIDWPSSQGKCPV